MSSPTSGSDPNHPQGGAPQGQPSWDAPQSPGYTPAPPSPGYGPASGYGPGYGPAPGYGSPAGHGGPGGKRPGQVTAAAVIGLVIGGLGTLGGLLLLFGIGVLFDVSAVLGLLALLSFATAVVLLVGGIQTLQGKSPRLLLLGSYASIAVQLLYAIVAVSYGESFFSGILGVVLPALIVFLLLKPQAKEYYAARGIGY